MIVVCFCYTLHITSDICNRMKFKFIQIDKHNSNGAALSSFTEAYKTIWDKVKKRPK